MTLTQATHRARERAKATRRTRYVVWSIEETDTPGEHYHVATEDDFDGFYMGCTAQLAINPDGTVEA